MQLLPTCLSLLSLTLLTTTISADDDDIETLPPYPNPLPAPQTLSASLILSAPEFPVTSGGPTYAGFNFDWHCGQADVDKGWECPAEPGWDGYSINIGLDLKNENLIAAAKQLAPAHLRIGGSQQDFVCYDIPAGNCKAKIDEMGNDADVNVAHSMAFVLSTDRWDEIVEFCETTGVQLVFGLNGNSRIPYGDYNAPLDWNANNTEAFVRYIADNGADTVSAFELGNELCDQVDTKVYADDIRYLRKLVDDIWPSSASKPLINGPDCNPTSDDWINSFLGNTSDVLNTLTYHNYVGYGLDPALAQNMMDTSWGFFDEGPNRADMFINGWKNIGNPVGMKIWAGEIAAAWHSGEPGVTDRFISSFWYADALGLLATLNHTAFQRQALAGGNYALLALEDMLPQSDFYVAQLFHNYMGETVLTLDTGDAKNEGLRSYAHCVSDTNTGEATLLLINVSPTNTFRVDNVGGLFGGGSSGGDDLGVFVMEAGDGELDQWEGLDSRLIKLNGELMGDKIAGDLGNPVKVGEEGLSLKPLTITFVVGGAGVEYC